jgi:hypothetical protein
VPVPDETYVGVDPTPLSHFPQLLIALDHSPPTVMP